MSHAQLSARHKEPKKDPKATPEAVALYSSQMGWSCRSVRDINMRTSFQRARPHRRAVQMHFAR